MAAHLAAVMPADTSEEYDQYFQPLASHSRMCLNFGTVGSVFSQVLDTPVKDDKQVMKELAKKFDAPTIRSVA